jgi:hypothetical protein
VYGLSPPLVFNAPLTGAPAFLINPIRIEFTKKGVDARSPVFSPALGGGNDDPQFIPALGIDEGRESISVNVNLMMPSASRSQPPSHLTHWVMHLMGPLKGAERQSLCTLPSLDLGADRRGADST